jgi:hypothetical protein
MTKQQTTTIGNPTFWEAADLAKKATPYSPSGPTKTPASRVDSTRLLQI